MDNNETTLGQLEDLYRQKLSELGPKQARFVEEYLIDLNATQAAIRAGYSEKYANKAASKLSGKVDISACIELARELRSRKTGITVDRVLSELKDHYERCIAARPVLDRQGNATGQYKIDNAAATRTLELIGKHLGMFGKGQAAGGKHLHLHQDKYANAPPMPKTIKEWVDQMREIGYDASIDGEEAENEGKSKEIGDK